jgi:hypothetical protein
MALAYVFLLIPILLALLVLGAWFLLILSVRAGAEAIRNVPYRDFLGPGGPDDPFTVRVPREEYEAMLSGSRGPTRTVSATRGADEQLPHPHRRTGLIRRPQVEKPRSSLLGSSTAGRGTT